MLEYEVEIASRPLGVRFAHADRGETVVVHLVLEDKLGYKLGLLPGDILIAVNKKSVLDITSAEALSMFRATKCPFKASFRRFEDDDEFNTSDEDEEDEETQETQNNDDKNTKKDDNNKSNNDKDDKKVQKKEIDESQAYQREQMAQIQYNLSKQVPSTVLKNVKHKRQESISLMTWSIKDVQEWLMNLGDSNEFKKYVKIFNDNKIDGKKLNKMDKIDLAKIGIDKKDVQTLYNEIQKSNKIFINPPTKSQLSKIIDENKQIKATKNESNEAEDESEEDEDNEEETPATGAKDDKKENNDEEQETGDNWEAPFLPYMYDAPTITLSSKTLVKVYTYRIVAPYKKRAFALYEIEVIDGKEEWLLSKRYSEFYRLYESMKKLGAKTKITFPKKGIFTKSTDKQVMEDRKKKLTNYLNELLKQHKKARDSKELNDFLSPTRTFVVDE